MCRLSNYVRILTYGPYITRRVSIVVVDYWFQIAKRRVVVIRYALPQDGKSLF